MSIQELAQKMVQACPYWYNGQHRTIWKSADDKKRVFLSRNSRDEIVCYVMYEGRMLKPSWTVAYFSAGYWAFNKYQFKYSQFAEQVERAIAAKQLKLFS